MISEIYAVGKDGTSAYLIVEDGEIVLSGSKRWEGVVSFEGVAVPADDISCEVIAVICAVMKCKSESRTLVNIYTEGEDCQQRYYRRAGNNQLLPVLWKYCEGMDVYADKWPSHFYVESERKYIENEYIKAVQGMK